MSDIFSEACRDIVESGECEADCCGPIPMRREFLKEHEDMIAVDYTDTIPDDVDFAFPVTGDLKCIFLDGVSDLCSIHEDRPDVCRTFGDESHVQMCCPFLHADGTKRSRQSRRKIERDALPGQEKLNSHLADARNRMVTN